METGRPDVPGPDAWNDKSGSPCPHPEVLAAFVDQGLGAFELAQIEAHVAGCEDCRFLIARVLDSQDAAGEPQPDRPHRTTMPDDRAAPLVTAPVVVARSPRKLLRWSVAAVL